MKVKETNKDGLNGKLKEEIERLKKSRNEIKKSKDHYQHLIENAGEIITILNYDGTIRFENPALKRILGYKPEELLDKNLFNYIHAEDRKEVQRKIAKVIKSVGNKSSLEFRYKHKKGEWRHLESFAKNIADPLFGPGLLFNSRDITDRVKTRSELEKNQQKLQVYTQKLKNLTAKQEKIRENERIRIARDIHDELGQMLTVLKMDISSSINRRKKEFGDKYMSRYSKEISEVVNGIDTIIQSVQRITMELRPGALVDLGLKDALEWQGSEFQKQTGIELEFVCTDDSLDGLNEDLTTAVFRIFQEILTNVMRHSKATKVDVLLTKDESHKLIMAVRDNGRGVSTEEVEAADSLGILGMRERSAIFGGKINIKGIPGIETLVTLKIPAERKGRVFDGIPFEKKMSEQ